MNKWFYNDNSTHGNKSVRIIFTSSEKCSYILSNFCIFFRIILGGITSRNHDDDNNKLESVDTLYFLKYGIMFYSFTLSFIFFIYNLYSHT